MDAGRAVGVKPGFVAGGGLSKLTGRALASLRRVAVRRSGDPAIRRSGATFGRPPAAGPSSGAASLRRLAAAYTPEARIDQNTCALQRFAE
ncbi:hypothetical protein WS71_16745 [Burkholderia mayonis]|uniref:Uncharacterized protein n=2 Tax=Burkholderia mayonis TaxID=1385591 RepID=A0A1B4FZE3_9BURK|nr:hypothetical protein WS71_16745 [Burkholderia mayonis]